MNATSGLALMITATWVLLLGETFILFGVIRPLGPNIHESVSSAVLKLGAGIVLALVWVGVMFALRSLYVRRVVRSSTTGSGAQQAREAVEPQK
jgi:hypothetical protein